MLHRLIPHNKKWLWLLLGVWLTVLQSVAVVHSAQHGLVHEHAHCLLCNFGNHPTTGPMAILPIAATQSLVTNVSEQPYTQPALPWLRTLSARAPPALFF
ncbi:hypothetical protein KDN34_12680 [Shewanella yunxiaonensis]|uniref:DUF2946 domain-containing protein n=1 Tax=Shewanella yunxiaonensis TaxID=2829809 RepID=A0ABX7YRB4_9GAMM|nr:MULTISPECIES: hypothetical protein [Shewanella]MDF0533881.1 hypothetical protein [Shewanella sp. A32]QUN05063.1 hypothetical protein KDN34_12680 [Shewanella yunxiaonensis]